MDHQAFAQLLGNYGEFIGAIAIAGTAWYTLRLKVSEYMKNTQEAFKTERGK